MKKTRTLLVILCINIFHAEAQQDTLTYLRDTIVANSNSYNGKSFKFLLNNLKYKVREYHCPYPQLSRTDTVQCREIEIYFDTTTTDKILDVYMMRRKFNIAWNLPFPNLHIKYLRITFSQPIIIKKSLLWNTKFLSGFKWTQFKAAFFGKYKIYKIEGGEF